MNVRVKHPSLMHDKEKKLFYHIKKWWQQHTTVTIVLALDTLGRATHVGSFPLVEAGNTKGGSITVPLTSCLTTEIFCFYL